MGSVLETMLRKVARLNKKYVHLCKVQKQAKVIHGDTLKTVVTLAGFGINWEMAWGSLGRFWKCFNLNGQSVSSVAQSCSTLCDPMNCSTPGLPVHHQLLEFTQTHVHQVCDAIQPSHPLSSPSPPAPNPSQHQSLFQWVNSSHEVAKVLEFQL